MENWVQDMINEFQCHQQWTDFCPVPTKKDDDDIHLATNIGEPQYINESTEDTFFP